MEEDITNRLLDVREIYNDVCGPFCLGELCLSILLVCVMSDHDNIRLLWKAIIVDEIAADSKKHNLSAPPWHKAGRLHQGRGDPGTLRGRGLDR